MLVVFHNIYYVFANNVTGLTVIIVTNIMFDIELNELFTFSMFNIIWKENEKIYRYFNGVVLTYDDFFLHIINYRQCECQAC